MEFIKENVPIDAKLETDPNMYINVGLGQRKSKYDDIHGYSFNYEREDAHLQMVILDYEAEDRVYRADQLWLDISNVSVIDVSAKMYAYEEGEWIYIENTELDPYLQKKSHVLDGSRLLVSGEQWENNYPKSRLLIAMEVDKTAPDNEGYGYLYYTTVQNRHHNTIWIGDYPIEFYWDEAFKVIFAVLCVGVGSAVIMKYIKKKRHLKSLMQ